MQQTTIRLFDGAFTINQKAAQRQQVLAVLLLLVQLGLLVYLVLSKGFAYSFVGLYLLHLLAFGFLLIQFWLTDYSPTFRHVTFTNQGIIYRTGFFKKQHDFDWDEIDQIYLQPGNTKFILKNEEEHRIPFDINSNTAARQLLYANAQQKGIFLTDNQN